MGFLSVSLELAEEAGSGVGNATAAAAPDCFFPLCRPGWAGTMAVHRVLAYCRRVAGEHKICQCHLASGLLPPAVLWALLRLDVNSNAAQQLCCRRSGAYLLPC